MSNLARTQSRGATMFRDIMNKENVQEDAKVFVTTWNMGNAEPEGFMEIFSEKSAFNDFDIFAIGLQESTYTIPGASMTQMTAASGKHESINHFNNFIKSNFPQSDFFVVRCYLFSFFDCFIYFSFPFSALSRWTIVIVLSYNSI
jgi:hypothetical protein